MEPAKYLVIVFICLSMGCQEVQDQPVTGADQGFWPCNPAIAENDSTVRGLLLLTHFSSFENFTSAVDLRYYHGDPADTLHLPTEVRLTHCSDGREVTSILQSGISEGDFVKARDGNLWDKFRVVVLSPYSISSRADLLKVYVLARRRQDLFSEGDWAFYDLAERMVANISAYDRPNIDAKHFSEKGFINTFNHFTAQAFMTSLFSEEIADFIADVHERQTMPELITGNFTEEQINDMDFGAVDNYVDMINNEWGQELGKTLKDKYQITPDTHWTPELLSDYLNDIQEYYSWAFQIAFRPFRPSDKKVIRFAYKMNKVLEGLEINR